MKKLIVKLLNYIFQLYKPKDNLILFESARGFIDESPKALYCYIKKNYPNEFRTIWLVTRDTNTDILYDGDFAYYNTLKGLYYLATAKYWIGSQSVGNVLKKKKNQIYIQTWHGYGPLKKMGYDLYDAKEKPVMEHVKDWDYFIASSPLDEQVIISSTGYNKKTVVLGSATTDEIIKTNQDINRKNEIKKSLGIKNNDLNKKIILYAPSFRDSDLKDKNTKLQINSLAQIKDALILVRLHPLIRKNIDTSIFTNNIINACSYPDVAELLGITDVLISDYSSVISKFAVLNKPIILYAYDLDLYLNERGFYSNYKKDMPGIIVYTQSDLINVLSNIESFKDKCKQYLDNFNKKYNYLNNGFVCERIVQKLREGFFKNE